MNTYLEIKKKLTTFIPLLDQVELFVSRKHLYKVIFRPSAEEPRIKSIFSSGMFSTLAWKTSRLREIPSAGLNFSLPRYLLTGCSGNHHSPSYSNLLIKQSLHMLVLFVYSYLIYDKPKRLVTGYLFQYLLKTIFVHREKGELRVISPLGQGFKSHPRTSM